MRALYQVPAPPSGTALDWADLRIGLVLPCEQTRNGIINPSLEYPVIANMWYYDRTQTDAFHGRYVTTLSGTQIALIPFSSNYDPTKAARLTFRARAAVPTTLATSFGDTFAVDQKWRTISFIISQADVGFSKFSDEFHMWDVNGVDDVPSIKVDQFLWIPDDTDEYLYFDGDTPGCFWLGADGQSESIRPAWSAAGGRIVWLDTLPGVAWSGLVGVGVPPVAASFDGDGRLRDAHWQRNRIVALQATIQSVDARAARAALTSLVLGVEQQPQLRLLVRRSGYDDLLLPCVYTGGLDALGETATLQWTGLDTAWSSVRQDTATLEPISSIVQNNEQMRFVNLDNFSQSLNISTRTIGAISGIATRRGRFVPVAATHAPPNGTTNGTIHTIYASKARDQIFIGGAFTTVGGVTANRIARYNPTYPATWSAHGSLPVTIRVLSDGKLAATDQPSLFAGGDQANTIWQLSPTTTTWTSRTVTGLGTPTAMHLTDDQRFLVAGTLLLERDLSLETWRTLAAPVGGTITRIVSSPDGAIYIGGTFTSLTLYNRDGSTTPRTDLNALVRLNTDGTWDALLPSGTTGAVTDMVWSVRGLAVSGFATINGMLTGGIALWNGTTWEPLGGEWSTQSKLAVVGYQLAVSVPTTTSYETGAITRIDYDGTAPAYPTILIDYADNEWHTIVLNQRTIGRRLIIDGPGLVGDTLTITCDPIAPSIRSATGRDVTTFLDSMASINDFYLAERTTNTIDCYAPDVTVALVWTPRYLGMDDQ